MLGQLLGLAGSVGSGGTSMNPTGGYGQSSASSQAHSDTEVGVGPIYGGGVDLGPDIVIQPPQAADRVLMTGLDQVNRPLAAYWTPQLVPMFLLGGTLLLMAFILIRKG